MDIVRILRRKDASSVVAAIVLGVIIEQAVAAWSARPGQWLSGINTAGGGWRAGLWTPLITLVVEIVVFELLIRLYIFLTKSQGGK